MSFKLISFDFNKTLAEDIATTEHLATLVKAEEEIAKLEAAFREGSVTTREFTDQTVGFLSGWHVSSVTDHMMSMPLVIGIGDLASWLKSKGLRVVINTINYIDALLPLANSFGFDVVSGVRLELSNSVSTKK